MKASEMYGVRPSVLILGKNSKKPWSRWDTLLVKAYQRFNSELCQQCGLPKYVCHTNDNRVQFKLSPDSCASAAVSEKEQARIAASDSKQYGVRISAEPYLTPDAVEDGMQLSDLRRPYLIERAKLHGFD